MRVAGYSLREAVRITLCAAAGFLFLKWAAPKLNQPALTTTVNKL